MQGVVVMASGLDQSWGAPLFNISDCFLYQPSALLPQKGKDLFFYPGIRRLNKSCYIPGLAAPRFLNPHFARMFLG